MGSIRLFGRGKGAAAADAGGAGLGAARIAEVLEALTAASMSTTWRCRHGSGVSIGEGAVDFAARRSRATVIRGKYTFEYVREGANVLRAPVTDTDDTAPAAAKATAAAVEPDADEEPEDDEDSDIEPDADEEFEASDADGDELGGDGEEDGDAPSESDDAAEDEDDAESQGGDADTAESADGGTGMVAWERFSENDACGVHAYAEPAVLAAGVRAAGAVQPREAQEFDGVLLSAYAVTLKPKPGDPNRVLARLARQLRDHGANVLVVTAFVDESAEQDEAGPRIVRVRVELPHWTPADDPTADHTVSVDLFEFDEPVKIDMPGAAGAARRASRTCADLALF